jgi:hypothetical protein
LGGIIAVWAARSKEQRPVLLVPVAVPGSRLRENVGKALAGSNDPVSIMPAALA